ncbi:T9SS type A sorting domain-containing protein, partial [candidate division KSB1 bacterium]|nr:T9SS type A sorting domain-containing protein [candidate division KSB1 bacterium]
VDILVDGAVGVADLAYGEFTGYLQLVQEIYRFDITPAGDNQTIVASYGLDTNGLNGLSAVVFASGFLNSAANQNGAAFGLYAALANGNVIALGAPIDQGAPNSLVFLKGTETYAKGKDVRGWENAVDGVYEGWAGTVWAKGEKETQTPDDVAWAIFRFADKGLYRFNYIAFQVDNGTDDDALPNDAKAQILEVLVSTTGMELEDFTSIIKFERKYDGTDREWRRLQNSVTAKYVMLKIHNPFWYTYRQLVEFEVQNADKRGAVAANESVESAGIPTRMAVEQNYPNPFNPATRISYTLDKDAQVSLVVYDMIGREVATLVDGFQNAGIYEATWNATGLPTGIYFYRFSAGQISSVRRMMFIK